MKQYLSLFLVLIFSMSSWSSEVPSSDKVTCHINRYDGMAVGGFTGYRPIHFFEFAQTKNVRRLIIIENNLPDDPIGTLNFREFKSIKDYLTAFKQSDDTTKTYYRNEKAKFILLLRLEESTLYSILIGTVDLKDVNAFSLEQNGVQVDQYGDPEFPYRSPSIILRTGSSSIGNLSASKSEKLKPILLLRDNHLGVELQCWAKQR